MGASIAALEKQLAGWVAQEKNLEAELRQLQAESQSVARIVVQVEKQREVIAAAEAVVSRAEAEVQVCEHRARCLPQAVVEEVAAASSDAGRRRAWAAGMSAGCGILVVLIGLGFQEMRARRVHVPEDVAQIPGLRLFGTLPSAPQTVQRRLAGISPATGDRGHRLLSEAVETVRTRLLYEADAQGLGVLMVTSAVPGEGKTALASQLAISLARAWKRTLLLDANLRNPSVHRLFSLPLEPGFSEVLQGEVELEQVAYATPVSRLWAVTGGSLNDHALQALAQDRLGPLFAELKGQYDFVVIDAPPVLRIADALMLGQHVNGVLLAVQSGQSRLPQVSEAHQRLVALGIPILGAVAVEG
jgi:capsular exopolysaccharide synthesis family protein